MLTNYEIHKPIAPDNEVVVASGQYNNYHKKPNKTSAIIRSGTSSLREAVENKRPRSGVDQITEIGP